MEGINVLAERLLRKWCEGLYSHQIRETGDKRADGAFICPACGKIHGRSADAIYPFMTMYSMTSDDKWLKASEALFSWSEEVVSSADGSYINDIDSDWRGITVFALISFMDALTHHGGIMPDGFRRQLEARSFKAASYLAEHDEYKSNNVNYPISIALALYMAGIYFGNDGFIIKSREYEEIIPTVITDNALLLGEGVPREKVSGRGCRSVDIGYNAEESIPSMIRLASISDDKALMALAARLAEAHMSFMLPDGGWDNSFGTRAFKWTYWGSRTSDGAAAALLMLPDSGHGFASAAYRNLALMERCTYDGLLYGGPDLLAAGQSPCIHHTFTHAKIPALIIDEKLAGTACDSVAAGKGVKFFPEIDTYRIWTEGFSSTVTGYDWSYMKGGHVSGGTMSLLYCNDIGPILISSMPEYSIKEANNQQVPSQDVIHECLAMRIEACVDGTLFSSIYDTQASMKRDDSRVMCEGYLSDIDCIRSSIPYSIDYLFSDDEIAIKASLKDGSLVMPVASRADEAVECSGSMISFARGFDIKVETGSYTLPYGTERIFNLVPGFQALKIVFLPDASGTIGLVIRRRTKQDPS